MRQYLFYAELHGGDTIGNAKVAGILLEFSDGRIIEMTLETDPFIHQVTEKYPEVKSDWETFDWFTGLTIIFDEPISTTSVKMMVKKMTEGNGQGKAFIETVRFF